MNNVSLIGRMVADPEAKLTTNGTKFSSFRIVVDSGKDNAYFFTCIAWKGTCDNIVKYFKKGQRIGISGKLTSRDYEQDGKKRTAIEILVESFDFCTDKKEQDVDTSAAVEPNSGEPFGAVPFEI